MSLLNEPNLKKATTNFANVAIKPDIRPEVLLRLSGKLQTTLDVSQIIEIFFKETQLSVPIDGISYEFSKYKLILTQGKLTAHTARYALRTSDYFMGHIQFHCRRKIKEYELANLEGLMTSLVYPLRNSLQYKKALDMAYRDPLTGAGNRVALNKTLERDISLAKRHQQNLSVLMMDLDHFKQINDTYGHSMGDKILQHSVQTIEHCIRQTDICFRYGGEEFLILLNNADKQGATDIAERIRAGIEQMQFKHTKGMVSTTTSIGLASLRAEDDGESLIERADSMLYAAKHQGRNTVIGDDCKTLPSASFIVSESLS